MEESQREGTLRDMRHKFYDQLQEMGLPEMGESGKNRIFVSSFLKKYSSFHNEELKRTCTQLSRTKEQERIARRAKHDRAMERKRAQQEANSSSS